MESVVYIGRDGEFDKNIKRIADALEEQNRINRIGILADLLRTIEGYDKRFVENKERKLIIRISEKLKEELELDMGQE